MGGTVVSVPFTSQLLLPNRNYRIALRVELREKWK
jgi:hypothetical protein